MDRKIVFASLILAVLPFAAGCQEDDARTHLDWGVNTTIHRHVAANQTSGTKTYTYEDGAARPTPRPAPNYVTKNVTPYAPVTSEPLAPIQQPVARADAPKNDGINIATAMDQPIHASASGTVTYAGDELKNYGNLILLKHAGGFTTAYAHADRLVVSRGDFVARGQVIGYTGQTGDVNAPQLHFEIRSNTTPVNPRTYLASTTASNQ